MHWFLRKIERLNRLHALIFALGSFGVGQVLNLFWPYEHFLIYQVLFIPAVIIAFSEIQKFLSNVKEYQRMTASHPNSETGDFLRRLLHSSWYFVALVAVSGIFIFSTISLSYISFDPNGAYALLMILLVMVSAVLGQTCYVYYIIFLRKIAHSKRFKYNFYLPARTDWVQLLAKIGTRFTNAFFVLGFIYTTVYYLNMPDSYVSISFTPPTLHLNTPNDSIFLISWIALFIIVIFAFPSYSWLQSRYMKAIVRRLKDASIDEIYFLTEASSIRKGKDIDTETKYYKLMTDIDLSQSSPQNLFNPIPLAATLCSIAVHLVKIGESL